MSTSELNSFSEGLRPEQLGGKWGFIDASGVMVIPAKYDKTWDFDEGLACVELNGKGGLIDKNGVEVIPVMYDAIKYDECKIMTSGNLFAVQLNGKWGYIDYTTGAEVVPLKYDEASVMPFTLLDDCPMRVKRNGKWGYIDKNGDEIIPPKYDKAYNFDWINDKAVVELDGQEGTIDTEGGFYPQIT
jgi:hypothetical protein